MSVNVELHKVVVIFNGAHYGFISLAKAVSFIEQQYISEDYSKVYSEISSAINAGSNEDVDLIITDIDSYVDIYLDDSEDEDGE